MKLITKEIANKLAKNVGDASIDKPWLKLFNPCGVGTWLISEYDERTGIMFGLCDLGHPELGYVSLAELKDLELPFGMKIERDAWWFPDKTLAEYAEVAK